MGQSNKYKEKYALAKEMYLQGEKSLTQIGKELGMDRGRLSKNLKAEGIEVINKQNITKFNENFFDKIDSEEKAYWLGFLYADGSVSSNKNTIELSLQSNDIKHLQKFKQDLNYFDDKHIYLDDVRCRIMITNKHFKESLINLGCIPKKSLVLTFPTPEQVPDEYIHHFVRGYVDGDGSVMIGQDHKGNYNKPRLSILGTETFLKELVNKMGWRQAKIQHSSNVCCVEWSGKYVHDYLDSLYANANVYLDRKYQKYLDLQNCRS